MRDKDKRFVIEVNKEQAWILSQACELLARANMAQFARIADFYFDKLDAKGLDALRDALAKAEEAASKLLNGIRSKETWDGARIAFDIHQVIRHELALDEPGKQWGVYAHDPMRTSKCKLATIRKLPGKKG